MPTQTGDEPLGADTFQPYFEYEMLAGCGIPSITLTGTPDDWRSVRRRASMLSEFGLEWWTASLLPVLDQMPSGTASAPVLLTDLRDGSEHPLRFVAGLVGVSQDASGALAPEFGWAVVHEPKK